MQPPKVSDSTATLPIVRAGRPILRDPAALVSPDAIPSAEIQALIAQMVIAMRDAPGVGLAAPQIDVGLRVIVIEDREALMSRLSPSELAARGRVPVPLTVIFNPTLRRIGDERATFFEGCLSVPGYMALVERDLEVEVTGLDARGAPLTWRARGWPARILQHEVDHLDGTLYVDRMLTRSFFANDEVSERWLAMSADEIRAALRIE